MAYEESRRASVLLLASILTAPLWAAEGDGCLSGYLNNSKVQKRFAASRKLDDRIKLIAARLNMPEGEVIIRLIVAGLDSTQDLALTEPQSREVAR